VAHVFNEQQNMLKASPNAKRKPGNTMRYSVDASQYSSHKHNQTANEIT